MLSRVAQNTKPSSKQPAAVVRDNQTARPTNIWATGTVDVKFLRGRIEYALECGHLRPDFAEECTQMVKELESYTQERLREIDYYIRGIEGARINMEMSD